MHTHSYTRIYVCTHAYTHVHKHTHCHIRAVVGGPAGQAMAGPVLGLSIHCKNSSVFWTLFCPNTDTF